MSTINNLYTMGDIHGDYDQLKYLLFHSNIIDKNDNWISKNSIFVFLGDYVHRGLQSLEVIQNILKWRQQAILLNSQIICLAGNHDLILLAKLYKETKYIKEDYKEEIDDLYINHAKNLNLVNILLKNDIWQEWKDILQLTYNYSLYGFQHADSFQFYFNNKNINFLNISGEILFLLALDMCDKRHFEMVTQEVFNKYLNMLYPESMFVFHGHTPHKNLKPTLTYQKAVNCDGSLSGAYNKNTERGFIVQVF